jgi:transposase-like protein
MVAGGRVAQLREDLGAFRERSRRGTYPSELRERAVAYTAERVRGGAEAAEIATELGVREVTARRWIEKGSAASQSPTASATRGAALSLIPLVVGGPRVEACRPRLRVDLPDGTRVHASGLAVSDVVEAILALRRGR